MQEKSLNDTFIPRELILKNDVVNTNSLLEKNEYEKVGGNIYLQIDPPQVKICGYQLDKISSMTIKVINKAPIPQRIHVLPPTQGLFTIKMNKKGSIPSGMSEYIQVNFRSNQYKYQYDSIKINTQTENFVVPLYAYPTIPNLRSIFPKIIDFGSVQIHTSSLLVYPITNPIPVDFEYEFVYVKECQQIMITPLRGIIPSQSTFQIQIAYVPNSKATSTSEVDLILKQFDFQPIKIKILGSGKDKESRNSNSIAKKTKSSKLAPIVTGTITDKEIDQTLNKKSFIGSINKKSSIRSSFPKLLANTKKSVLQNKSEVQKTMNIKKIQQKDFLTRFNRVQQQNKAKQIKFCQYLGNPAMSPEEIEEHNKTKQQFKKAWMDVIETCKERFTPYFSNNVQVQHQILVKNVPTFNDNKNDQLKIRRNILDKFEKAGTKIILKYRMTKRLKLIKQFIGGAKTKAELAKKVQQNYIKSLQVGYTTSSQSIFNFQFSKRNLQIQSFPIYHDEDKQSKQLFQVEGKAQFDDLKPLSITQKDQNDIMKYTLLTLPPDFISPPNIYPSQRTAAQQEYPLRSPTVPDFTPPLPTSVYSLPLKTPTHFFLYDNLTIKRYNSYEPIDQKDVDYLFEDTRPIEDQFSGWTGGDYELLKAKFMRNPGCEFLGFEAYTGTGYNNDVALLGKIDRMMPLNIEPQQILEDQIQQGDSDEEKNPILPQVDLLSYLNQIQTKDNKAKERRNLGKILNEEQVMRGKIQKNIKSIKQQYYGKFIDKGIDVNKWANQRRQRINI